MHSEDARGAPSSIGERYRVLLDVGRTLAGTLSSDDLYAAIHDETARVLEASGFYVSLYDQARDLATIVFFADHGRVQKIDVSYRGSDSEVIRERRAILVNEGLHGHSLLILGDRDSDVTRSAVSAPMIRHGRVLGTISAQSYRSHAYSEDDLALLQAIADIAAVAVENARYVAELEQRRREAEQIEEIGRALTGSLDAQEVLGKVIEAVLSVLDVDGASVWLCDGPSGSLGKIAASGGEIRLPVGLTWDLQGPMAEKLIELRRPIVVEDLASSTLIPEELRDTIKAGSGLGVPLVVGGQVAGVLTAGSRQPRHFAESDTAILQRLASQAAVALENARLHASLQALSLTDPLTGLPNRRHLQIHLEKEVAAARRGRNLVVILFDLDDFKQYNDSLGHLVGDDILRAFGQILHDENRAMNLVARYGGDEFVSVLSESEMDGAIHYAERVKQRMVEDLILSPHGITVSCGMAQFDRADMKSPDDIIHAADADMYRSKQTRSGRRAAST